MLPLFITLLFLFPLSAFASNSVHYPLDFLGIVTGGGQYRVPGGFENHML